MALTHRIYKQIRYPNEEERADVVSYYASGDDAEWRAMGNKFSQWCEENCAGRHLVNIAGGYVYFSNSDDLMLFLVTMKQTLTEL